jgi:hypothetical protein
MEDVSGPASQADCAYVAMSVAKDGKAKNTADAELAMRQDCSPALPTMPSFSFGQHIA